VIGLSALTLFCGVHDSAVVEEVLTSCGLSSMEQEPLSRVRRIHTIEGRLAVTRLDYEPGTEFSHVILGALDFVRCSPEVAGWIPDLPQRLQRCDMMLGVSADPPLEPARRRWSCLARLAAELDAVCFDGARFFQMQTPVHPA
jgi:hypothetical protein